MMSEKFSFNISLENKGINNIKYNLSGNKLYLGLLEKDDNNSVKDIRKAINIMRISSFNTFVLIPSLYIYLIGDEFGSLYIIFSFAPSTFCLNFEIK